MGRVGEIERREAADRGHRFEIHADAVRPAPELGVVEHEIEHLRKRQRDHDEVDAFHPDHEGSDHERADPRDHDGRGQRQPEIGGVVLGCEEPKRVGADAEERGVAKRYEPGVTNQEIQGEREDREDHHLGDELGVERRAREREQRERYQRSRQRNRLPLHGRASNGR